MNRKKLGILLFFGFLANMSIALAQTTSRLTPMFQSLSDLGIIGSIGTYPYIWDAVIFLTLFIGMGRVVFKDRFSPQIGGVIGFVLAVITMSGELTLQFSVTQKLGPWFLIGIVVAVLVFLVRFMFKEEGNNRTGAMAFGIFLILTLILEGLPTTGNYLSTNTPLLFSILMLVQFIALVFSIVWFFRIIGSRGGDAGGVGNWLGRRGDGINSLRDGGRRFLDSLRGRPGENDEEVRNLRRSVANFTANVNLFQNDMQRFRQFLGHYNNSQNINHAYEFIFQNTYPAGERENFFNNLHNFFDTLRHHVSTISSEADNIFNHQHFDHMGRQGINQFNAANLSFVTLLNQLRNMLHENGR